jgi:glycosyltransferase involved in cell wall biosynthesis
MPDLFVLSDDVVGEKMAGPGIRAWEMTKALSRRFEVALAVPEYSPGGRGSDFFRNAPFDVMFYSVRDPSGVKSLAERSRLLLVQGYILSKFPILKKLGRPVIADIYDPFVLENLFVHQRKITDLRDREAVHLHDLRVFNDLVLEADHFLCASERQKDLFLGSLLSLNRISPRSLEDRPAIEDFVSVVPFGIAADEDDETAADGFRRKFPKIAEGDIVLLWGGVISNWFDPISLIRAFAEAIREDRRLKLVFMSTTHPNPRLPVFEVAEEAKRLAAELKLLDDTVFFHDDWVEYKKRASFFRRANIGVSIHELHFETRFSFRTRMLDYIKYGLPVLCTEGDYFAGLVAAEKLGEVVGEKDISGIQRAILALAADPERRADIKKKMEPLKSAFAWDRVVEPLTRYCEKILSGSIKPALRPPRRDVIAACSGAPRSRVREWLKRRFWPRSVDMNLKTMAKIRRHLRF